MGIPHLTRTLAPYADWAVLDNSQIVVDGPGLAYHVIHLCTRHYRSSNPFNQPPYDALARTAIAWLDNLQSRNISVYVPRFYVTAYPDLFHVGNELKG